LLLRPSFPDTHEVRKPNFEYDSVYFNNFSLVLFNGGSVF
jgi:hypothetical protein